MVHGDNSGLVLPPRVASVQVCVGRVLARILNLREVILGVGPVRHEYSYYPPTYSSNTVVSPMMTKIIGGTAINETADTNSTIKLLQQQCVC